MSYESFNEEVVSTETQENLERTEIRDPFNDVDQTTVQQELDANPQLLASLIQQESE